MPSFPTCHQGGAQPRAESSSARCWRGAGGAGPRGRQLLPSWKGHGAGILRIRPAARHVSEDSRGHLRPPTRGSSQGSDPLFHLPSSSGNWPTGVGGEERGLRGRGPGREGHSWRGFGGVSSRRPREKPPDARPRRGGRTWGLDPTRTLQDGSRQSASSCGPDPAPACYFFFLFP